MSKRSVADFFSDYAADFSAIYATRNTPLNRVLNRFLRRSMRLRFERTVAGCSPVQGRTVLDIGCGGGHYSIYLARLGAKRVVGIDFADGMIDLARTKAQELGVAGRCEFILADFMHHRFESSFDYSIAMGFMDYTAEPQKVIQRTLSVTKRKAFFSFPKSQGLLAWQRRLRYRRKCDLYMYDRTMLEQIFSKAACSEHEIQRIARDYFVTAMVEQAGRG